MKNNHFYLKAAEKFDEVLALYDYAIEEAEKKGEKFSHLQLKLARANREHVSYEKENCLYLFFSNSFNHVEAEKHVILSINSISTSINILREAKKIEPNDHLDNIEYDLKRWNYYLEQAKCFELCSKFKKAYKEDQHGDAIDYSRAAIESVRELKNLVEKCMDVLEREYLRIIDSTLSGIESDSSIVILNAYLKMYVADSSKVTPQMWVKILREGWNAYKNSVIALEKNPIWDGNKIAMENQKELLVEILKGQYENWKNIYIQFEDDKEFHKLMKEVNTDKYNKINKNVDISNNKNITLWSAGSFFLLSIVIVFGAINITVKTVESLWKVLISLVFAETLIVIIGIVVLRTIGGLSESGFIKLLTFAIRNQFIFLSKLKKNYDDDEK